MPKFLKVWYKLLMSAKYISLWILLTQLSCGCQSIQAKQASTNQLVDPNSYYSYLNKGDYFTPISILKAAESDYLQSSQKNQYVQVLGTLVSFGGKYDEARKYFELVFNHGSNLRAPQDLSKYESIDAVRAILANANSHQVLMINEAHHVPETRALTKALLGPLYKKGFRIFAAETFSTAISDSQKRGYPLTSSGFYSKDPVFADLIREAIRLGYKLVPYENELPCDYSNDPNGCQDKRERNEASNLFARTLAIDPSAKILVHAGYGHIDKKGGSSNFPWVPMAKYFWDVSGIEPYSIDQVEFQTHWSSQADNIDHKKIVDFYHVKGLIALRAKGTKQLWSATPDHYDVHIIFPMSSLNDSKPLWFLRLMNRKSQKIESGKCSAFPCLIQAFYKTEYGPDAIPLDQLYVESSTLPGQVELALVPGDYVVRWQSTLGNITEDLKVK